MEKKGKKQEVDLHFSEKDVSRVEKDIDAELHKFSKDAEEISVLSKVKDAPVEPGYMRVALGEGADDGLGGKDSGLYGIDLNQLLSADLSNCPGTVLPTLLDNTVAAAFAKRDAYRIEKRKIPYQWLWLLIVAIGVIIAIMIILMVLSNMKII